MNKDINDTRIKYQKRIINLSNKKDKLIAKTSTEKGNIFSEINRNRIRKIEDKISSYNYILDNLDKKSFQEIRKDISINNTKKRRKMILTGDLLKTVLAICLPIAVYNFFNSFYNLIDSVVCSSISASSVSKVATLSQVKSLISAIGAGLAGGGAIIVSRYYGEGNVKEAKKNSTVLFTLSLVVSVFVILILIPFAKQIILLAGVPNVDFQTKLYFQLQLFEIAIISLNSVFIGLEKAKGNSKKIFTLNIMVLIIKLVLTVTFVYGFNVKNICYIELATIIGQLSLLIVGISMLTSKKNVLRISIKDVSLRMKYVKPILILAGPIMLGKAVMSLGKVIVNSMCGHYYNVSTDGLIVGALSVSNNLSGLVTSPTNAFEEGGSTIVSQNLGAKNMKRALHSFYKLLIVSSIITFVGFLIVRILFTDQLINLFSSKNDKENIAVFKVYVKEIFKYDSISIISLGLCSSILGLLYGYGKTILATILNLSRIGTRIITLFVCHKYLNIGYKAAGISMGISNVIILLVALGFLFYFLIVTKKKGYKGMYFSDPEPDFVELVVDNKPSLKTD